MKNIVEAILNRKTSSTDELKSSLLEPFIIYDHINKDMVGDGFLNLEDHENKLVVDVTKYPRINQYPLVGFIDYEGIIRKFRIREIYIEGKVNKSFTLDANKADFTGITMVNNTNKTISLTYVTNFPDQLIGDIKTVDNYAYKLETASYQKNREYKIKDYYYPIFAETSEFGKIGMTQDIILQKISDNISIPEKKLFYFTVPKGWLFFIKGISNKSELKNYKEDVNKPLEYNKFKPHDSNSNLWWCFNKN